MSWKLENNTKRIYNVFKRSKSQIYSEDIEALKEVLNHINDGNKAYVNDNILFAKLLTINLTQNLNYYGTIDVAIKEAGRLLTFPLNHHLEILRRNLNEQDLQNYFESIGIVDWKNTKEREANEQLLKDHEKEIVEKCKKNWTLQKVEKSLINSANDFLKDVDNYK
jgi:hypothetical protein